MEFRETDEPQGLLVLFSLPKSGSQALEAALNAGFVRDTSGRHAPWTKEVPNGLNIDMPLTRKHLRKHGNSGFIKTHAPCTFATLDAMAADGNNRYLVVVRNPVDQLVAFYCHVLKHINMHRVPGHPELICTTPMANCRADAFATGRIDDGLLHLIRDGYLDGCLRWMADWLHFRSASGSRVVRYENFISNTADVLLGLQNFMSDFVDFSGDHLANAVKALADYRRKSYEANDNRDQFYPRGWTGTADVRTRYLSAAAMKTARDVVAQFSATSPHGRLVTDLYPELLSDDVRAQRQLRNHSVALRAVRRGQVDAGDPLSLEIS